MIKNFEASQDDQFYKEMFDVMVQESSASMYLIEDGRFSYVNNYFCILSGYTAEELISGKVTLQDLVHPEDLPFVIKKLGRDPADAEVRYQIRFFKRSGEICHIEIHSMKIKRHGKELVMGTVYDVTTKVEADLLLKESEERFKSLFDNNPDSIFVFDLEGNFTGANDSCETLTGYSREELMQMSFLPIVAEEDLSISIEYFQQAAQGITNFHEISIIQKNGARKQIEITKVPMHQNGEIIGIYGIAKDITEKIEHRKMMEELIYYDALTKLPNRKLFEETLHEALAASKTANQQLAVLFLDLDRFKFINDSLGHHMGDEFLKLVAQRLAENVQPDGIIGRFAGDEFAVLLPGTEEQEALALAKNLNHVMAAPFQVLGHSISVTVSIGVSVYCGKQACSDELIKQADMAMYYAKKLGKNNYKLYSDELDNKTVYKLTLENDLKTAVANGEFVLHYQPVKNLNTGKLEAIEALIRWQHPHLGMVPPDTFIPISEESGQIVSIGNWVLQTACSQIKSWQKEGYEPFKVCVNISTIQLQHPDFIDMVKETLEKTDLAPEWLELEITESILLEDTANIQESLRKLKAMGISLSIDDFGTGYTSLSYLRQFSFDRVKIDRSFINDIAEGGSGRAITSTIISLAKKLNMGVIAEGIEEKSQLKYLKEELCENGQGYYFSKPLPPEKLIPGLKMNN
ncbi:putative bifunctional diguanylate cyclase/phosphodiesterase [Alkalicoccus daliensis]|uniref:PAS domain S-box-containing protein/diguanylate cyclase (GGDEF) domain-containing protein n=1 Tax=Alkalicoccus daliensis TaxID=745820 RepID=A0A1H0HG89_9BACI|nr:EAL domain-containing protein [Alkalicoccus daliensis]SDO18063.1 PAS domain S-box-containing protein/diguanylate cyclase (GGDEF) domain-containing protein [Alkalicoccus daliensis]